MPTYKGVLGGIYGRYTPPYPPGRHIREVYSTLGTPLGRGVCNSDTSPPVGEKRCVQQWCFLPVGGKRCAQRWYSSSRGWREVCTTVLFLLPPALPAQCAQRWQSSCLLLPSVHNGENSDRHDAQSVPCWSVRDGVHTVHHPSDSRSLAACSSLTVIFLIPETYGEFSSLMSERWETHGNPAGFSAQNKPSSLGETPSERSTIPLQRVPVHKEFRNVKRC